MNQDNYFIKQGYINNPVLTFSENPKQYWTEKRISASNDFQYHVYEYAGKLFEEKGYQSLLDIGAGPGTKLPYFFDTSKTNLVLIDQPGMEDIVLQYCPQATFYGRNLEDESLDIGRTFDFIICADVIEHLLDPEALLKIIYRHLKNDGIAILSTPDRDMRRGKESLQSPNKAHIREWNKEEFKKFIVANGFSVKAHLNLPLKKLSPFLFGLSQRLLYRKVNKSIWFGNQLVVISKINQQNE